MNDSLRVFSIISSIWSRDMMLLPWLKLRGKQINLVVSLPLFSYVDANAQSSYYDQNDVAKEYSYAAFSNYFVSHT